MPPRTPQRSLLIGVLGVVLLAGMLLSPHQAGPLATGRASNAETFMVALVNEVRAEHGLAGVAVHDDLSEVAYAWSVQMARDDVLAHNPSSTQQVCCWQAVAENVAFAEAPRRWWLGDGAISVTEQVHDALLDSPLHRANLLDPDLTEIGIGIEVTRSGRVWITQSFRTPAVSQTDR